MNRSSPLVSVVLSSYTMDRFDDLAVLLDRIESQTYRNSETIVVVERSSDLRDRLLSHCRYNGYTNTRVLFSSEAPGLSPARNLGVRAARGGIIAFIDDDAVPFPDWLERIVEALSTDASVMAVTGYAFPLWETESMEWYPKELYWIIGCSAWSELETQQEEVRNVWGANMAFRREALGAESPFDEEGFGSSVAHAKGKRGLICDDTELSLRLRAETGKRILFDSRIRIWHNVYGFRLTPGFARRYAYQHAYSKAVISRRYGGSNGQGVLTAERQLLRRILFGLLPRIALGFLKRPVASWRSLAVTATVLLHTFLGYSAGMVRHQPRRSVVYHE